MEVRTGVPTVASLSHTLSHTRAHTLERTRKKFSPVRLFMRVVWVGSGVQGPGSRSFRLFVPMCLFVCLRGVI